MKPACKRCTTTGRKCEGYQDQVQPPKTPSVALSRSYPESLSLTTPFFDISGTFDERRSFHYLRVCAVYDISGYFESGFWDRLVLQLSHSQPTVRHALLALSSLCEIYDARATGQQELSSDKVERLNQFALQQYNKAIGLLASDLAAPRSRLEVTLTTCLVFIWLEFLRDDFDSGLNHLESGLKILRDFNQPDSESGWPSRPTQHIDISLTRLFTRLDIQATIHGSPTSDFNSRIFDRSNKIASMIPSSFLSIDEARKCLDGVLSPIIHLIRQLHQPNYVKSMLDSHPWPDPLSLEARRQSGLYHLQLWQAAVDNSASSIFKPQDQDQASALAVLNLYHRLAKVILNTLFTTSQMIFDEYNSDFEYLLALAESVIHNYQSTSSVVFLDMGVMPPLFFIVVMCRDLGLRRKALALLKRAPHREGMWHREHVVAYAEWKAAIEERGRGDLPETAPLPEYARVFCGTMEDVVVDGRRATLVRFQRRRGGSSAEDDVEWGEDLTDLGTSMAQMI